MAELNLSRGAKKLYWPITWNPVKKNKGQKKGSSYYLASCMYLQVIENMHLCYLAQLTFQGHDCQNYESDITFYIVHLKNILTTVSAVCQHALQKAVFSLLLLRFNITSEIISFSRAVLPHSKSALN